MTGGCVCCLLWFGDFENGNGKEWESCFDIGRIDSDGDGCRRPKSDPVENDSIPICA
jgi:hypothetical protein